MSGSTAIVVGTPPRRPKTTGEARQVLAEHWLPLTELGVDAGRERRAIGHLPPLFLIHLWWARRPVGVSQGVQLAALLPAWDSSLAERIPELARAIDGCKFLPATTDAERYQNWVMWVAGLRGDNVRGQLAYDAGESASVAWPWPKAWQARPSAEDLTVLHRLLVDTWGRVPVVLDPTAGGGTIPFAALRYGLRVIANDLNTVAVSAMLGSIAVPERLGKDVHELIEQWGARLIDAIEHRLAPYFPAHADGQVPEAYIFANTITCPRTGGPIPLVPNWWLARKGRHKIAAQPHYQRAADGTPEGVTFSIVAAAEFEGDPSDGTLGGGSAFSPWDELPVDGQEIKRQARSGAMTQMLYAVKVKGVGRSGWEFRPPTTEDLRALEVASAALAEKTSTSWNPNDVLPTEERPELHPKNMIQRYGYEYWRDFFTPRQLLVHGTFVEVWRELLVEARESLGCEVAESVFAALAMMQAKALDYNSKSTEWTPAKNGFSHMFARHDFAFKSSFAEYEGASRLWRRGLHAELLPYLDSLVSITRCDDVGLLASPDGAPEVPGPLTLSQGSAADLGYIESGSVDCVNCDPPYYDNVFYSEMADFFYVWEKRTLGTLYPDRFKAELTDRENEAVANVARFGFATGKEQRALADADYEGKMRDIFAECRRVLRDDGVMVIWFTHKRAEAWDTLGSALMDAGFTIETSWPVNTESSVSLNQVDVNAAKSTIVLLCRKRLADASSRVFFEDVEAEMRSAAREAAESFEAIVGNGGVDLMLATYGPTLSVLSRCWPVYRSEADAAGNLVPIRPEEALDIARAEVAKLRIARLVGHERRFDPTTDFVVLAWSLFADVGFPYDEARKLALGVGADASALIEDKVLAKKGSNVSLVDPRERVQRRLKVEGSFASLYDAVSVMLRLYDTDGAGAVRSWLVEHGYEANREFKESVLALANAVPRVVDRDGDWSVELAGVIDEVARNVPSLGLRLAEARTHTPVETWEDVPLAFGLDT